jgi:hypothetical protein
MVVGDSEDEHGAPPAAGTIARNLGGRPKRKPKRAFTGVRNTAGRPVELDPQQPSTAAAAAGQRQVRRRKHLSYDVRKQNLSEPAPRPYFKARPNSRFFVPELGQEPPQQPVL